MRAASAAAPFLVFAILAGAWACGSEAGSEEAPPDDEPDATRIDLAYCTRYCDAQAKSGTLIGTRTECVRKCCRGGGPDCVVPDGGLAGGADGDDEPDARASGPDGSACAVPCGSACCGAGQACHTELGSAPQCTQACEKGTDCGTGCCAPATNAKGDPIGPYVCKQNDGKPYHCCNGLFTTCTSDGVTNCCVTDPKGNRICAQKCDSNFQCGSARCVPYTFGSTTTCFGPNACGP
jgi:hypothetical protein